MFCLDFLLGKKYLLDSFLFTCKIQITFKSLSNGMIKVTGTDVCVVRGVIYSLLLITALELILFFTISLNLV